jgi:hypothetical protein
VALYGAFLLAMILFFMLLIDVPRMNRDRGRASLSMWSAPR